MKTQNSFILYHDMLSCLNELTDEELWKVMRAVFVYHQKWELIELDRICNMAFKTIKTTLDRDRIKWEEYSKSQADRAKKRWDSNSSKAMPPNATACQDMPSDAEYADSVSDSVSVSVSDNAINNYKEIANKNSLEVYPVFLYYFLDLGWKPWSTDTVDSLREWMRSTLKNGWINSASDAIQVLREFHAYWDTQRDEKGFKKKNWKKTLLNSPSLPNNKRKYESK